MGIKKVIDEARRTFGMVVMSGCAKTDFKKGGNSLYGCFLFLLPQTSKMSKPIIVYICINRKVYGQLVPIVTKLDSDDGIVKFSDILMATYKFYRNVCRFLHFFKIIQVFAPFFNYERSCCRHDAKIARAR